MCIVCTFVRLKGVLLVTWQIGRPPIPPNTARKQMISVSSEGYVFGHKWEESVALQLAK